jgi:hypothetical protein
VHQEWTARQRVLAAITPIGPVLLVAGSLITPAAADDFSPDATKATLILEAVEADRARSGVGGFLIVVGLMFLVPALALVVARVTGKGERLATVGGMLAMAAMAAGSLTNTFFFTSYGLTSPDVDAKLDDLGSAYAALGPVLTPFFIVYLAGSLIGFLVLAVAVFRARSAPRWAAIALALAGLGIVVVDTGTVAGVILSLLLLVALMGCGILAGHDAAGSKSTNAA